MRAIVHIGTEKTGSTSIQEYLYLNRKRLVKFGYHFVQSAGEKNNRALPAFCMANDKYDDFFREHGIKTLPQKRKFQHRFLELFQNEIRSVPDGIHTVILSSEHFHSRTNTADQVRNVHKLLSPLFSEIEIICYLRDQASMCTSFYSTAIKSGYRPSFIDFLKKCDSNNIYYNHSTMLSNWEASFGLESLNVSIFSKVEFLNGNLLDDFTAKLDPVLVDELDKMISIENESLSYAGQVLGMAVNSLFPLSAKDAEATVRRKCQTIIYDYCKGKGERPSLDQQKRIYSEFAESNEMVRQRFFPDRPVLFDPIFDDSKTDKSIDDGFIEALSGILQIIAASRETGVFPVIGPEILPDNTADTLRDAALRFEKSDLKLACDLMILAHKIRPKGPVIKRKLEEYRQKLGQ